MPPDRQPLSNTIQPATAAAAGGTASRFSDAIASGQPLSSVGPGHPPSLERGKACLTCRRRRVKCDGARPVCGRCAKSAKAHGEDPTTIVCEYDSSVPKRGPKDGEVSRVSELAAEVAALKQQLLQQQREAASSSSAPPPSTTTSFAPSSFSQVASTSAVTLDSYPAQQHQPPQPQGSYSFQSSTTTSTSAPRENGAAFDPASFLSAPSPGPFSSNSFNGAGEGSANPLSDLADLASSTLNTGADAGLLFLSSSSAPAATGAARTSETGPTASTTDAGDVSFTLPADMSMSFDLPDFTLSPTSLSMFALLPASYPPTLPSPALLNRLLTVYFSKSHLACQIIHEGRLRASLLWPHDDPRAPLECLLHAMCATAGLMVGEAFLEGEPVKYWLSGVNGEKTALRGAAAFSEYHAKRAEELLQPSFDAGRNLLQVVQAAVLCVFVAYTAARFQAIWSLNGRATRLAVITGLNHTRPFQPASSSSSSFSGGARASSHAGGGGSGGGGHSAYGSTNAVNSGRTKARRLREPAMLPPARDASDVQERLYTFWAVLMADRMTCAATDWAMTIAEEDVTSLLPAPDGREGMGDEWFDSPLSSPLCTHNPSFFFANPPHLVGPHQLYIKAIVLLGRVCTFLQRAPEPVGSGYPLEEGRELREEPTFRTLERTISHFRQSIPRELQYSYVHLTTGRIDERLILAHSIGHVVVILMHEPFCLSPDITIEDESFSKCLEAAKAIVSSVYEISGSSFEIGTLASFLNWVWAVAGRTLVRALALASRRTDLSAASHLAMDVKALIGAMEANKSAVGAVTASVLQRLLTDPFQVLPDAPPSSSRDSKNFSSRHRAGAASASSSSTSASQFNRTSSSLSNPSGVVYLSAFDPPYDGEELSRPRVRGGEGRHCADVVALWDEQRVGGGGGGAASAAYPGTIWEVLDDTPPSGNGSGGASEAGAMPGGGAGALEELARKVVEEVSAASATGPVGIPGGGEGGWP
ncbi:hypothetical protein JCM6882_004992 [Rhodosporidiobolus microsporus]